MSRHIRLPIAIATDGTFTTVAEDSVEEITQNVTVVLRTRTGERLATPDLGTPDPTFTGLDPAVALDMVRQVEPRADLDIVTRAVTAAGVQAVDVQVRRRENP